VAGLEHLLDHAVDAQAQLFDVAPVEQRADNARIAAEVLVHDVVDGDEAGQPAGRADLQPVAVHADLDPPPAQPVIAVADGVDQRLAHGKGGVLVRLLALQPAHHRADRHLPPGQLPDVLHHARQRAGDLLAAGVTGHAVLAARLRPGELDKDDPALG